MSADPTLFVDLDDTATVRNATGQGDPEPPGDAKARGEAAALLAQAYQDSYDRNGDDPADGTHDPTKSIE